MTDPATPVDAVTESWPEPYGGDPDVIAESCAFEGHQPWATTGDNFHGVVQVCACGDRLYDLTDKEIPK